MDEQEAPSGTVAEVKPAMIYEPVVPTDLLKVMTEEKIPTGAMMFHLVRNATPEDHDYIKGAIEKAEADLAALRTIDAAFAVKFSKSVAPELPKATLGKIVALPMGVVTSPEPKPKRKYTKRPKPVEPAPETAPKPASVEEPAPAVKHAPVKPMTEQEELDAIDREYDPKRRPMPTTPLKTTQVDIKPPDATANARVRESWARRIAVAKYLLDGKRTQKQIQDHFEIPSGSITAFMSHPFFHKDTDGYVYLTTAGRRYASDD